MSFWPLPGGSGQYLKSLRRFCRVAKTSPSEARFLKRIIDLYPGVTSEKAARSYMRVAVDLGFLKQEGGRVVLTTTGRRYLDSGDKRLVRDALFDNIAGIEDILAICREEPRRIGLMRDAMNSMGYTWQRDSQLRYRLAWLQEVGVLRKEGKARSTYHVIERALPAAYSR